MMALVNSIPDNIGWALVGAAACACAVALYCVGKTLVEAWKERMVDEEA